MANKPETGSARLNKPETDAEALAKKEFLIVHGAFVAILNTYKRTMPQPRLRTASSRTIAVGVEARRAKTSRHIGRAIVAPES